MTDTAQLAAIEQYHDEVAACGLASTDTLAWLDELGIIIEDL